MLSGLGQLLDLLVDPLVWLFDWCPRMSRLHVYENGVRVSGKKVRVLKHGCYFYVPNWHEILTDNIVTKTISLPDETQTTKDGRRVRVGGVLVYHIRNVETWLTKNEDAEEGVLIAAARVLRDIVVDTDYENLKQPSERLRRDDEIVKTAQEALGEEFGIWVKHLGFTTFCETEARDISHSGLTVPSAPLAGDDDE